ARIGYRLAGGARRRGAAAVRLSLRSRAQHPVVWTGRRCHQTEHEQGRPHRGARRVGGPAARRSAVSCGDQAARRLTARGRRAKSPAGLERPPPHDPERSTVIALRGVVWSILLAVVLASMTVAQQYDPRLFDGMRWRLIGPFRGGRTVAAVGVSGRPDVLYIGVNNGGVWKSDDYGRTWTPIFADQPTGSIGERGVVRSSDGGAAWEKVLYTDENTGAVDVALDPANPQTVFAVLWAARQAPWEIGSSWTLSAKNGLYKSTDSGTTWRQLTGGLPGADDGLGRIGLGFAASAAGRVYAVLGAKRGGGLYRS